MNSSVFGRSPPRVCFGLIADIAIGIVGALIASWLLPHLGIHLGFGIVPTIIGATIGANSPAVDSYTGLSSTGLSSRSLVIKSEEKLWLSLGESALSAVIGRVMRSRNLRSTQKTKRA
jgi:hypothetical protein